MWSAAILAGGQARRFDGRDKSALVVDGRSILERQLAELAQIADDIMIVAGDADRPVPEPARLVRDRVAGRGPLAGVQAALAEACGEATFVVACDMPYISARFAEGLLALTAEADVVVPLTEHGYHPLCAAYTQACLPAIARRLADGRLKMLDLLEDLRVRVVTGDALARVGDPRRLLANVNTPSDYVGLGALQGYQL